MVHFIITTDARVEWPPVGLHAGLFEFHEVVLFGQWEEKANMTICKSLPFTHSL